jgi:hypothetical protein
MCTDFCPLCAGYGSDLPFGCSGCGKRRPENDGSREADRVEQGLGSYYRDLGPEVESRLREAEEEWAEAVAHHQGENHEAPWDNPDCIVCFIEHDVDTQELL